MAKRAQFRKQSCLARTPFAAREKAGPETPKMALLPSPEGRVNTVRLELSSSAAKEFFGPRPQASEALQQPGGIPFRLRP